MAKIFISYRRDDSEYQTDRLHRELKQHVENPREDIFIDVDNIPYGVDFVEHLESKVSQCEMLLAVIGKGWLSHKSAKTGGRSLDDPSDFVRIEIETALSRGIPVVPVMLDGTPVPSPESLPDSLKSLARRNAKFVNRMSFDADVKSLVQGLPIALPPRSSQSPHHPRAPQADDGGGAKMWLSIEHSLDSRDYEEFKEHFSNSKWTFEAGRRIRQLGEWKRVDSADLKQVEKFHSNSALYSALSDHIGTVLDELKKRKEEETENYTREKNSEHLRAEARAQSPRSDHANQTKTASQAIPPGMASLLHGKTSGPRPNRAPDLDERIASSRRRAARRKLFIAATLTTVVFSAGAIIFVLDPMNWRTPLISEPPVSEPFAMIDEELGLPSEPAAAAPTEQFTTSPNSDTNETGATIPDPRPEAVRKLQSSLRDLGYYSSTIDGEIGLGTRSAVSTFSSQFGGPAIDLDSAAASEIENFTSRVEAAIWGEEKVWQIAQSTNTLESFREYYLAYPKGQYIVSARERISALSAPNYRPGQTFQDRMSGGALGPEMVVIPSGSFTMGSPENEPNRQDHESPLRSIRIDYQFAVGKFEVTWAEWDACVAGGGCSNKGANQDDGDEAWGKNRRPVINVDYYDARSFVLWLSSETGEEYRLLSEAEWEYVARAGTQEAYWWGAEPSRDHANYGKDTCCGGAAEGSDIWEYTSPVGSFPANNFNVHDMTGNVAEWVADCFTNYTNSPRDGAAYTPNECEMYTGRGGSWFVSGGHSRSANRFGMPPVWSNNNIGFRVARAL